MSILKVISWKYYLHSALTVFIIYNNIFIPVVWKSIKTVVPVLIFWSKVA